MNKRILLLGLIAAMASLPVSGIDLVKNGMPRCVIVPGDNVVEQHAAAELALFLEKITGAKVRVGEQPSQGKTMVRFVLLGKTDSYPQVDKLRYDGFIINASPEEVVIASRHRRGFLYGVYHIIRNNGVEWFYPGVEGEYIERKDSVSVPDGIKVVNPYFEDRQYRLNGGPGFVPDTYDWLLRNGVQVYREFANMEKYDPIVLVGGHVLTQLMVGSRAKADWEALLAEQPELFGMRNGKRVLSAWWSADPAVRQPCTSNPEVVRRVVENAKKLVEEHKDREIVFDFIADDHGFWCECDNCSKLDFPEEKEKRQYSTRWWLLLNEVAAALTPEKYPNLSLRMMAYLNYVDVPVGVKPASNVRVTYCGMSRCYFHAINDPNCPRNIIRYLPRFEAWAKSGARITNFEYHNCLPTVSQYVPYERAWISEMKYRHGLGMIGAGLVTSPPEGKYSTRGGRVATYNRENVWYSQWQLHWLAAYFMWNIDDDYETVLKNVSSKYYGAAWPAMRQYRIELEKAIEDFGDPVHLISHEHLLPRIYAEPGVARKLTSLLNEAVRLAAADPVVTKRLEREQEYLNKNYAKDVALEGIEKYSGKLVFNGDFELTAETVPKPNEKFVHKNNVAPHFWRFNFRTRGGGYSEIRTDSPFEGKSYLRLSGERAVLDQMLSRTKPGHEGVKISARVRGKGKIKFLVAEILDQNSKHYFGPNHKGKWFEIDSDDWILLEDTIKSSSQDLIRFVFENGTLDIDDLQVVPLMKK